MLIPEKVKAIHKAYCEALPGFMDQENMNNYNKLLFNLTFFKTVFTNDHP